MAPQIILLPLISPVVKYIPPWIQFTILDVIRLLLTLLLFFLFPDYLYCSILIVGIISLCSGCSLVTMENFLANCSDQKVISSIQAWLSSGYQISLIIGPAFGSILISNYNINYIIGVIGICFIISACLNFLNCKKMGY